MKHERVLEENLMRGGMYPRIAGAVIVAFTLSLPGTACLAAGNGAVDQGRIDSVGRLLTDSTAARKIAQSGNPDALARHREAQSLHDAAQAAYLKNEKRKAGELLAQATRVMFEAARMAENGDGRASKRQHDFDAQMASVEALLNAFDRIAEEKAADRQRAAETHDVITSKVSEARSLQRQEKPELARKMLDEAYLSAKIAIEQLRGGDTLVRHLSFASKKEEYDYELDRNDTHRMLVDILLREKLSNATGGMEKLVRQFIDKAAGLRSRAEQQAAKGEYANAVETLELSTREIVRAIRSAGVYIPG